MIKSYPMDMANRLISLGEDWADKEGAASLLEETRKSVRAQVAVENFKDGGSAAKAELIAECSAIYTNHVEAMIKARTVANKAKVNFEAHRVLIDLTRTAESTKRAEMGMR